ncbi:MAG: hypothetical protein ACIRZ2_08855, partial [Ligilactobacillus ruminis]
QAYSKFFLPVYLKGIITVDFRQVLSGIFLVLMNETLFAKCSAAQSVRQSLVTGKTLILGICP